MRLDCFTAFLGKVAYAGEAILQSRQKMAYSILVGGLGRQLLSYRYGWHLDRVR
jgi:hypothetical protein